MLGLGTGELLIIGGIVFLLFGAKRIPMLGSSLAKGIKNFQKGLKGEEASIEENQSKDEEKKS